MGVNISYMGTKKELAPSVADVIGIARNGILLDVFSGMCSVGEEVGPNRQVWTNDVQVFSAGVGAALFTSQDEPLEPVQAADIHFGMFDAHRTRISQTFAKSLKAERALLEANDFDTFEHRGLPPEK